MPDTKLANATGAYGLAISRIYAGWSIDAAEKAASVSEKYGAASVEGRGRSAVNP